MAVKKLDRDGDGKVSRREWKKKPSSVFDEIDTNADGLLTKEEFAARFSGTAASAPVGKNDEKDSGTRDPSQNPLHPAAARDLHERTGLFNTGVVTIYPQDIRCLEVKSFFGDKTRYDGSQRTLRGYHGYHSGFDISADEGTPLVAIADGEVVHKYTGGKLVGNQIFLRHTPEDTGLPIWVYSKYKHFRELPALEIGDRVKMGQALGASGKTGTTGGHFGRRGYPHLHLSLYGADSGEYRSIEKTVLPEGVRFLDPAAIYLMNDNQVYDNHGIRALPKEKKTIQVPYMTSTGTVVPADSRLIWPVLCEPTS